MQFKGLDLNLLVVLDALLTEESVTKAGEKLKMSQPSVSGSLAKLRDYFNDPLLIQSRQKMLLTPAARMMAVPVREFLAKTEELISLCPGAKRQTGKHQHRLAPRTRLGGSWSGVLPFENQITCESEGLTWSRSTSSYLISPSETETKTVPNGNAKNIRKRPTSRLRWPEAACVREVE